MPRDLTFNQKQRRVDFLEQCGKWPQVPQVAEPSEAEIHFAKTQKRTRWSEDTVDSLVGKSGSGNSFGSSSRYTFGPANNILGLTRVGAKIVVIDNKGLVWSEETVKSLVGKGGSENSFGLTLRTTQLAALPPRDQQVRTLVNTGYGSENT